MKILEVEIGKSFVGSKGTHISDLIITYETDNGLHQLDPLFRSKVKTFCATCGLTSLGKFYVNSAVKDEDKVIPELKKLELFQKVRVSIAADALKGLIGELGEDAVKLAFDEALVKLVDEA